LVCRHCGCCCSEYALPLLDDPELVRFLLYHGADIRKRSNGETVYFVEAACRQRIGGRCAVYEDRPSICREYDCKRGEGRVEITQELLDERERRLLDDMHAIQGALQDVAFWRGLLAENPQVPQAVDVVRDLLGPDAQIDEPVEVEQCESA
jgi:hypothetical protein